MSMTTAKVSNVSLGVKDQDLKEFFSFSGDIVYLETQSETEGAKVAYVTFKDVQGAETAVLLTGATIGDSTVTVTMAPDYQLPPHALVASETKDNKGVESALRKAEDAVSSMLAKGFVLGKDTVAKAKSFDEKHQLTSTASATVASLDKKIGFTEKINAGTAVVSDKVREVDQKFHVSEKTKSAIAAAEQTVNNAGTAIMNNRYVLTGTTWVTGAFNRVAKAAEDVGQKAKEKVGVMSEGEEGKRQVVDEYARVHLSESPKAADPLHHTSDLSSKDQEEPLQPQPQQTPQPAPAAAAPSGSPAV